MIKFTALPLEGYASIHEISFLSLLGLKSTIPSPRLKLIFDFNLQIHPQTNSQANFIFHVREASTPSDGKCDFCITNLTRWRVNVSRFETFTGYLNHMKSKHYTRYTRTQRKFTAYGAKLSLVDGDWSPYAEAFFRLYLKVAKKHGTLLYDLNYFLLMAKQGNSKLLCVHYEGSLIGGLVILEEHSVFHSMCCGVDYDHSKTCMAYSWMHYEFIRIAIEAKRFTVADVGLTADQAKSMLDFEPVSVCLDVKARSPVLKGLLHAVSPFISATIGSNGRFKFNFHLFKKK